MSSPSSTPRYSAHTTAWVLVLALVACLTLPMLTRRGMFIDGIFYASISRNLAVGIGDPWHPQYTATYMTNFREHPTLGFVIESWWFRVLGDHYWVETLYSLSTAIASGGLIVLLWRHLTREDERLRACGWLPILLWVLVHGWRGAYGSNVLENTLGCFTLLAVYCLLRARDARAAMWLPFAALAITAALFTKGPVALFPLATPALAWLTLGRCGAKSVEKSQLPWLGKQRATSFARLVGVQFVLVGLVAGMVTAVLQDAAAWQYIREYWQQQVLASLSGRREVVASSYGRLFILLALGNAVLSPAILAGFSIAIARWRNLKPTATDDLRRAAAFCLLTGLSASLPLAISPKQLSFYTAPSWPFYALALALWCAPAMLTLLNAHYDTARPDRRHRAWRLLGGTLASAALIVAVMLAGTAQRDRSAIADAAAIAAHVPPHTTLSVAPEVGATGALQAYLYRTHYISVAVDACPSIRGNYLFAKDQIADVSTSEPASADRELLAFDAVVLSRDRIVKSAASDSGSRRP